MRTKKEMDMDYRNSKAGVLSRTYSQQKTISKKRGHNPPTYTKQELKEWLYSQELFHVLFNEWKRLDFISSHRPSVDRKEDHLGYTMNNIQLMTWQENNEKGYRDRQSGKSGDRLMAIIQVNSDNIVIDEFVSLMEAERVTGVNNGNISLCLNNKRKTAGGFKWILKH